MKKLKPVLKFRPEAEERDFWEPTTRRTMSIGARSSARFPNLSTTSISRRLPQGLLEQIKVAANKRDVPHRSLIKVWLAEKIGAE
jgi:hypothetical protein